MINESHGRQLEILLRLKVLNREAHLFLNQFGKRRRQTYHELWKTSYWREAKVLLKEYFTIENNGKLVCKKCGKELTNNFTLHHETYNDLNLFHPLFVEIVCSNNNICHEKGFVSKRKKKK